MVPDRRTSKAVKRARRSHHALKPANFSACPRCGTSRMPHRACGNCGFYNAKVSLEVETEES